MRLELWVSHASSARIPFKTAAVIIMSFQAFC